jgi:hypothetical protein
VRLERDARDCTGSAAPGVQLNRTHAAGPERGPQMSKQVLAQEYVKVIQLENGILFHSWVIGLPYFFSEPIAEVAESKPTVSVH